MGYARIQREPFSLDAVLRELQHERVGGVTFYVGTVRTADDAGRVDSLTYEAYPEMAQSTLEQLRLDTVQRFGLVDAIVVHRVGRLGPSEPILLVALSGAHRTETYDAIRYFMDRLKEVVPIWKKEEATGGSSWILGAERRRARP